MDTLARCTSHGTPVMVLSCQQLNRRSQWTDAVHDVHRHVLYRLPEGCQTWLANHPVLRRNPPAGQDHHDAPVDARVGIPCRGSPPVARARNHPGVRQLPLFVVVVHPQHAEVVIAGLYGCCRSALSLFCVRNLCSVAHTSTRSRSDLVVFRSSAASTTVGPPRGNITGIVHL